MKAFTILLALSSAGCAAYPVTDHWPTLPELQAQAPYACGGSDLDDRLYWLDQHVQDLDWDLREAQ